MRISFNDRVIKIKPSSRFNVWSKTWSLLLLFNIILDILDDLIRQENNKRLKKIGSETSGMAVREAWRIPPAKQLFNG